MSSSNQLNNACNETNFRFDFWSTSQDSPTDSGNTPEAIMPVWNGNRWYYTTSGLAFAPKLGQRTHQGAFDLLFLSYGISKPTTNYCRFRNRFPENELRLQYDFDPVMRALHSIFSFLTQYIVPRLQIILPGFIQFIQDFRWYSC